MSIPGVQDILEKDLFELLGIGKASDEHKEALLVTMINAVDARVANRIAEQLTDTDADEFSKMAESGDSDGLVNFLVEKEIDLPKIVSDEATRYRIEVAQLIGLAENNT